MNVDEKDLRILRVLAECESGSPDDIHVATGIPKSTVHYRLNRLKEKGVLTNDLCDVDRDRLGLSLTVISEVEAQYEQGYHDEVGDRLAEIDGVNQVYFVMGDTDFVVISHLARHDMVKDLVEQFEAIEGVRRTSSKFVIQTAFSSQSVVLDYEHDALVDALSLGQDDIHEQNEDVAVE